MALIKCPECGHEVSDKSMVCVNCGCPLNVHNTVTIKLPKDNDVIVTMKYEVKDGDGKVLASGISGETLRITLDEPTTLACFLVGRMYRDYKIKTIDYIPHGEARYIVIRRNKGFQSWVEITDEMQFATEETNQQSEKKNVSGAGIFFAVLIAIIAAAWLIPRLFFVEWTIKSLP